MMTSRALDIKGRLEVDLVMDQIHQLKKLRKNALLQDVKEAFSKAIKCLEQDLDAKSKQVESNERELNAQAA